jgi:hypothetical protein
MDDKTFHIKNLEFHIKQTSVNYDVCVANAIKQFMNSDTDFKILIKPCEQMKTNLDNLMMKYSDINSNN